MSFLPIFLYTVRFCSSVFHYSPISVFVLYPVQKRCLWHSQSVIHLGGKGGIWC